MDDATEPTRAEVDALPGATMIEFVGEHCRYCDEARPLIDEALATRPGLRHLTIVDGKGRALGRTFRVLLWPTLIFLADGHEVARVVRPKSVPTIRGKLAKLG